MAPDALIIPSAYLLDLLLGDPRWLPHPVRWMGRYIESFERWVRPCLRTPLLERAGGILLLLTLSALSFSIPWMILEALDGWVRWLLAVLMAYTTLAARSLHREVEGVVEALGRSEGEAKARLSMIVGRDTAPLDREGVLRATVETLSENASDGVIAPLFYLLLGGPPLAMAYKAVSTLDSMVGYRDERYLHFGWASARADDVMNYIPARITALFMLLSSFLLGLDWRRGLVTLLREGRKHPSPNAGLPEAVASGVLGVRLGGGAYYRGVYHRKPAIGEDLGPPTEGKVEDLLKVVHGATLLSVLFTIPFGGYTWIS